MSQVCYQFIPFEELVRAAPVIVVAGPRGSAVEAVPVGGTAQPGGGPCPPFSKRNDRFRVSAVLRAPPGLVAAGDEIVVSQADLDAALAHHRRYHAEGLSVSPIYLHYHRRRPGPVAEGAGERLLFLAPYTHGGRQQFVYAVQGGTEDLDRLDELRALLAAPRRSLPGVLLGRLRGWLRR